MKFLKFFHSRLLKFLSITGLFVFMMGFTTTPFYIAYFVFPLLFPGEFTVKQVHGNLFTQLQLQDVHYQWHNILIRIAKTEMDIRHHQITLHDIHIQCSSEASIQLQQADLTFAGFKQLTSQAQAGKIFWKNHQGNILQTQFNADISDKKTPWTFYSKIAFDKDHPHEWAMHGLFEKKNHQNVLTINHIDVNIHPQRLKGNAIFLWDRQQLLKSEFLLKNETLQLAFTSRGNQQQKEAHWWLKIPELAQWLPLGRGSINSIGHWQKNKNGNTIDVTLNTKNLILDKWQLQSLSTHIQLSPKLKDQWKIFIEAKNFQNEKPIFTDFNLQLKGLTENHHLKMDLLKENQHYSLQLQGHLQASKQWRADIERAAYQNQKYQIVLQQGQWQSHFDAKGLHHYWQFKSPGFMKGEFHFLDAKPLHWLLNAPIKAHNEWRLPYSDLIAFTHYHPFSALSGNTQWQLSIDGTWKKPLWKILGDGNLNKFILPYTQTPLENIHFNVKNSDSSHVEIQADAVVEKNPAKLNIHLVKTQNQWQGNARLQANHIRAVHNREYEIFISPTLLANYMNQKWMVSGNIFIPEATLKPQHMLSNDWTLSRDIVFSDQKNKKNNWQWLGNIELLLGDKVFLDAHGLKAQVTGQLLLKESESGILTGNGELILVNGQYTTYGQKLDIHDGKLTFPGGPLDNPTLNIKAIKNIASSDVDSFNTDVPFLTDNLSNKSGTDLYHIPGQDNDLVVGLQVQGTAKTPRIQLFSLPSTLNQADILSYLILGHASENASQNDFQRLLSAAHLLNLEGQDKANIVGQLQHALHLDKIQLQSNNLTTSNHLTLDEYKKSLVTEPNTSLVIGKKLSPKLYMSYNRGLLQQHNSVRMRYNIDRSVSVQTESDGTNNGIDLFYSIER